MDGFKKYKIGFLGVFVLFFCGCRSKPETNYTLSGKGFRNEKTFPSSHLYFFAHVYNRCFECRDSAYQKYQPKKTFVDFPSKIYNGPKHPINYKSNRIAREYKTAITNGYKEQEINFAGHYVYVSWGCGSPCSGFAIVDALNGNVYPGFISAMGCDYRNDSYLMIADPPDENNFKYIMDDWAMPVNEYLWMENKHQFIETELE